MAEQIYSLIGKAMGMVGAIGKDSVNEQQKYKFRGIDAIYNALNPVMSQLGLFICPEIIDHRREERETENVYSGQVKKSMLKYSILTIRYTIYAPDGSNISCTVVGEGMDSGDKASNKAMSVALKYAMFQLLMIPTEEMIDPDKESHDVTSGAKEPPAPKQTKQEKLGKQNGKTENKQTQPPVAPPSPPPAADVSTSPTIPNPKNPVQEYLSNERRNLQKARGIPEKENADLFTKQLAILRQAKRVPDKPLSKYTMDEAQDLIAKMYTCFTPTGTVLKDAESA